MSRRDFENQIPIDDALVVLDLLVKRWGGHSTREIDLRFTGRVGRMRDGKEYEHPFVEIGHHHDFSDSTIVRLRVTQRVVDELVSARLVAGKPEWGRTDDKRLHASDAGVARLWDVRKACGLIQDDQFTSERWFRTLTPMPAGDCIQTRNHGADQVEGREP